MLVASRERGSASSLQAGTRRLVMKLDGSSPGAFFRPREAGEGDHWSSRSERTVVEGALDSPLRCRCKKRIAMKLLRSRAGLSRANLESAYDVDSCVALR